MENVADPGKNKKEMPEIKKNNNTVSEMKNAFHVLFRRLSVAKGRISELEYR